MSESLMHMGSHHEPILAEIYQQQGQPGLEVFFNIHELPEFTADIIDYMSGHIGETTVTAVCAPSGIGKWADAAGIAEVIAHNQILQDSITKGGSTFEWWYMSLADRLKQTQLEGGIEADVAWNHFTPKHFQRTSADMKRDIGWAIFDRPEDQNSTRLVVVETVGIISPSPTNSRVQVPFNLDLGGSLLEALARYEGFFAVSIKPNAKVEALALAERIDLEKIALINPTELIDSAHPLMKKYNKKLDRPMTAWELYTMGGNEFGMRRMHNALNANMAAVGSTELGTSPFTIEQLDGYPDFRETVAEHYIRYVFESMGIKKFIVGSNEFLNAKESGSQERVVERTHFTSTIQDHKFPYERVPRYPQITP